MTAVDTEETPNTKLVFRMSKGRSGTLEAESGRITSEPHYIEALRLGIEVMCNRGTSSINKASYKSIEEFQAAVMAKGRENLEALYAGTLPIRGAKAKGDKVAPEVMKLAREMARTVVKSEAKRKGFKVSLIKSSVITKFANALLVANPSLITKAKEQLEEQQLEAETGGGLDLGGLAEDPELKAKAAQAKADKQLSAAKAGKVATRGRPGLHS